MIPQSEYVKLMSRKKIMPPENTRTSCPTLDKGIREAEVGFEPRTFSAKVLMTLFKVLKDMLEDYVGPQALLNVLKFPSLHTMIMHLKWTAPVRKLHLGVENVLRPIANNVGSGRETRRREDWNATS
ncbi:hypothetical protein T265_11574 [Opisthorchis viverrini]|uniref:Uncharacterized protein n=1 Tax=Opisthorchis viverrini TaxID=6198 RepID=A0A074Z2J9_OPIVI|nr:hypothetical protein T265_11574 [Opisthorchis viverrini]KER19727.1 hypothetical protein T265_11574 [Opisthorchis viverrini]